MTNSSGIYIHVPFCRQGCLYCHFVTVAYQEHGVGSYVQALLKEMQQFSETCKETPVLDSIYLGGGTPSLIPAESIEAILDACRRMFSVSGDCEISMECNPETLVPENLAIYRRAGINRISVGAQSLQEKELIAVGRKHSAASVIDAVELLKRTGIEHINMDILIGLPFQTLNSLENTLKRVAELDVEHVSVYMLDLDEPCQLSEMIEAGRVQSVGDDTMAEMYLETREILSRSGYRQYEISNYARINHDCRHNIKYWRLDPVIGFGLGSHSFDGFARWANLKDMKSYLEAVSQGKPPVEWRRVLTRSEILEETLFLGLRMNEGVDWKVLQKDYPVEVLEEYEKRLRPFCRKGLVKCNGSQVSLTVEGMLLSNEIFQELV